MLLSTLDTVDKVVKQGLCTGCGSCVAACPRDAIEMKENVSGLLAPTTDSDNCSSCGLCARVCPGDHLDEGLIAENTDPFGGPVMACYMVQHRRHNMLTAAQSGGAVTGLILHLMEIGRIDRALVTVMPQDGSLRPYPVLTRDPETIRKSCGSKYCPVPLNIRLSEIDPAEQIAVVGLSCHLHGVVHLCRHLPRWRRENFLLIGLVCDRTLSFFAMDYLIRRAGLDRRQVRSLCFRSKLRRGWPGDVRIETHDGMSIFLPAAERIACKDIFTPKRCRLCFDKMNVLSDITCGDPHGLSKDVKGNSAILARTLEGQSAVLSAIRAGIFTSRNVSKENIFVGQGLEDKRRDYAAYSGLWRAHGRTVPEVPIVSNCNEYNLTTKERHIRKKYLFDFPVLVESDSMFRQSCRIIRWNRCMKLFNRLLNMLLRKVVT